MRTVSRPELGLDAGALTHEEGERGVARLDIPVVLLHELPAGRTRSAAPPREGNPFSRRNPIGEEASVATWRRRWPGKTGRIGRGSPSRSGTGCHATPSPPAARARFDFSPPAVGEMGGSEAEQGNGLESGLVGIGLLSWIGSTPFDQRSVVRMWRRRDLAFWVTIHEGLGSLRATLKD